MKPSKALILAREPAVSSNPNGSALSAGNRETPAPALVPVANRPLLGHALDWLGAAGIREAMVICGERLANEAREAADGNWPFEVNLRVQRRDECLGESLAALRGFLDGEPFVLHLADSLARESLTSLLGDDEPDGLEAIVVVHTSEDRPRSVVDIRERLGAARGAAPPELGRSATAGVAVLGAGVVNETSDLDAWPGSELNALAGRVNQVGGRVRVRRAKGWWRFGHGADTALEGNRFALEALGELPLRGEIIDSRVQGAVSVHPTARLDSSVVRGPVVIGAGVRLRDAYVGPYTSIGDDVVIEGAEVEYSIVMPEASIRHLGARLEGSIVGARARVFRDFGVPRAMRLRVAPEAEVSLP